MAMHSKEKQLSINVIRKYKKISFMEKLKYTICGNEHGIILGERCSKCNGKDLRLIPLKLVEDRSNMSMFGGYSAMGCADCGHSESWYVSSY